MGNSLLLFSGALPVILFYYTTVHCDLYDNFSKNTKKIGKQVKGTSLKNVYFAQRK